MNDDIFYLPIPFLPDGSAVHFVGSTVGIFSLPTWLSHRGDFWEHCLPIGHEAGKEKFPLKFI